MDKPQLKHQKKKLNHIQLIEFNPNRSIFKIY